MVSDISVIFESSVTTFLHFYPISFRKVSFKIGSIAATVKNNIYELQLIDKLCLYLQSKRALIDIFEHRFERSIMFIAEKSKNRKFFGLKC